MDAYEWSAGIYALAVALSRSMTAEEVERAALLFTQLGTTLSTIAALQALDAGTAAGDTQAADLSTL